MVYNMVSPGEKYEGYIPIFQGDNNDPHQDAVFLVMLLNTETRMDGNGNHRQLRCLDEIWDTAELVWKNLPSCNIASVYVQAHRIATR
eukprot:6872847-Ditylum_brightwellii.AAC.1